MDNSHIRYYSAEEEEGKIVAQSNIPVDDKGNFLQPERIKARQGADFPVVTAKEVNLMDVASGCASGNFGGADCRYGHRKGDDFRQPHSDCGRGRRRSSVCRRDEDSDQVPAFGRRNTRFVCTGGDDLRTSALPSYQPEYVCHAETHCAHVRRSSRATR